MKGYSTPVRNIFSNLNNTPNVSDIIGDDWPSNEDDLIDEELSRVLDHSELELSLRGGQATPQAHRANNRGDQQVLPMEREPEQEQGQADRPPPETTAPHLIHNVGQAKVESPTSRPLQGENVGRNQVSVSVYVVPDGSNGIDATTNLPNPLELTPDQEPYQDQDQEDPVTSTVELLVETSWERLLRGLDLGDTDTSETVTTPPTTPRRNVWSEPRPTPEPDCETCQPQTPQTSQTPQTPHQHVGNVKMESLTSSSQLGDVVGLSQVRTVTPDQFENGNIPTINNLNNPI